MLCVFGNYTDSVTGDEYAFKREHQKYLLTVNGETQAEVREFYSCVEKIDPPTTVIS